jgi:carbamoyltransferase
MHILGFDCYGHDSAAAIVRDGQLLGLVEEERFVQKKHVADFPVNAIRWCCEIAGIEPAELDHVVYYWDPKLARLRRARHLLRYFPWSLGLLRSRGDKEMAMLRIPQTLRESFGLSRHTKIHFAPHHVCHAASSFLTSSFDEAAILTIDAAGEWDCTWLGRGCGLDLQCLKTQQFPNSLGLVYGAVTEFLGFKFASGEGKVMGLAPYGDSQRYIEQFRDVIKIKPEGGYEVDLSYFAYHYRGRPHWFSDKFYRVFGAPRPPDDSEINDRHRDVAAALQLRSEEVGLHMARWLHEATALNKICLAGGVCLNSVMNGRILMESDFRDVVVQPAANDAGTALGACYWLWNLVLRQPRTFVFEHAYVGPWMTKSQCRAAIARMVSPEDDVDLLENVDSPGLAAEMLAGGKIIGWFQGRMEMGPRALGNRSILADPRSDDMKDMLNARVKFRESFRPFAPSVLKEKSGEWFETDYPSPYMIMVYDVLHDKRPLVPAITHVDGTGRVQTVNRKHNPKFHRLIEEFERLTGVPMVLNTSFNIRGQPIVHSPEQAIECFLTTGMDALFLEDFVLVKRTESAAAAFSDEELQQRHAAAAAADNSLV